MGQKSGRGFTLPEFLAGLAVLVVGLGGLLGAINSAAKLHVTNQETALATEAARSTVERVQGAGSFQELFARFNASPEDDPGGFGSAEGSGFAVPDLRPQDGDPDGMVGEFRFPVALGELREDVVLPSIGAVRDLNGDGVIDDASHSDDYVILPVSIRLQWRGAGGNRTFEISTYLVDR